MPQNIGIQGEGRGNNGSLEEEIWWYNEMNLDPVPKDAKIIITKEDYETLHELKHRWGDFKNKYFALGRIVGEINSLFDKFGSMSEDSLKNPL